MIPGDYPTFVYRLVIIKYEFLPFVTYLASNAL